MKRECVFVIAVVVIVLAASPVMAEFQYNIIDLGTLGGRGSDAKSINNNGQIVGVSETSSGELHATLFDSTGQGYNVDLGTLGRLWATHMPLPGAINITPFFGKMV